MRCLVEDLQTKTETVLLILVTNNGRGKLPTPPPHLPPVRNLTTEKNSLSTRKKPINDLSIIIIESKK